MKFLLARPREQKDVLADKHLVVNRMLSERRRGLARGMTGKSQGGRLTNTEAGHMFCSAFIRSKNE